MPRLRVAAGNFGATYSMRCSDFAPTDARALRGLLARRRQLAFGRVELVAAEADGARFVQPGIGRGEIAARQRAADLAQVGVAEALARGRHRRIGAVGA